MALHIADTGPAGSGWMFSEEFRLRQVQAGDVKTCCGIANKMCYWLGCPMVASYSGEAGAGAGAGRDTAEGELQSEEVDS